jgi:4-amino-4-deoxy-L-arabinose transferase-like glycosyltransferase
MKVSDKAYTVAIITLLLIGYFFFNDVIGPRAEEPRRAVVGIETLLGENALVPKIHGEAYYNKPPVFNWILAGSFWLFDSFKTSALRFPGVLSLWIVTGIIFLMMSKLHTPRAGLFSALIFLTFGDLLFYGAVNSGEIDLFYTLVTFLQASAIFWFGRKSQWTLLFVVSYFLTSVGFLTKGLPSLAFQALTVLFFLYWLKQLRLLFNWRHFLGLAVFLALVGGYFLLYSKYENAQGLLVNLWSESSSKSANNASGGSIFEALYSFPFQLLQITLPWIIFIFWGRRAGLQKNSLVSFSYIFILANIWLYWISPDLRNRYVYTFFPFIAIIIGNILARVSQNEKFNLTFSSISSTLAILIGLAFVIIPFLDVLPLSDGSLTPFALFGVVFIALGIIHLRRVPNAVLQLTLLLAIIRLAYNVCILPAQAADSKTTYYADQVEAIIELTGNESILWSGHPYRFSPEVSLFGKTWTQENLSTPPLLAYQIPYYYSLHTKERLIYQPIPDSEQWLLGYKDFAEEVGGEIVYEFRDKWIQKDIVLYRILKN